MSDLKSAITEAAKAAMKARDEVSVRTLRLLQSDLKRIEVDERRTLSDADVLAVLQKSIKRRKETIDAAQTQGRQDIVSGESAEIAVLERFLPAQLSEAELVALVENCILEAQAKSRKEQGKVMQLLMPRLGGRADGKLAARLVSERLGP